MSQIIEVGYVAKQFAHCSNTMLLKNQLFFSKIHKIMTLFFISQNHDEMRTTTSNSGVSTQENN